MRSHFLSLIVLFTALLGVSESNAITIDIIPSAPNDVDIIIAGLDAGGPTSLGAFDIDLAFDPLELSPIGITFGPFLGDPSLFEALTDVTFSADFFTLAETSLLDPGDLDVLQPTSFSLATITFNDLSAGINSLRFSRIELIDSFGQSIPPSVPEPTTLLLMLSGVSVVRLLGWGKRNRDTRKKGSE